MFVVGTALPAAQDAWEYAKTVRSNLVRLWAALTPHASPCPLPQQVSAKNLMAKLEDRATAWVEDKAMKEAMRNIPAELRGVVSGAIAAAREGSLSKEHVQTALAATAVHFTPVSAQICAGCPSTSLSSPPRCMPTEGLPRVRLRSYRRRVHRGS
jgi:hypothetical protein